MKDADIEKALFAARDALNEVLSEVRQVSNDLNLLWATYTGKPQPSGRNPPPKAPPSLDAGPLPSEATAPPGRRVPPRRRTDS